MYTIKNCYYKNSKISEDKFKQLIKHFAMDLSASDTARLIGVSVRSVNDIFLKVRVKISEKCELKLTESKLLINNSFAEQKLINNQKISCSICGTTGYIYTKVLPDVEMGLSDLNFNKRNAMSLERQVPVGKETILGNYKCANDVSMFWEYSQARLKKFKGIPKNTFLLHLKETEFRFNSRELDLYEILLEMIESDPI